MSHQHTDKRPDCTRREFLTAGAVAAAGVAATSPASGAAAAETLAVSGGPKAVTFPADRHTALTGWPRYGDAEKQALSAAILGNDFYASIASFEKEWKEYIQVPYVKAQMNGTSALTAMFFALSGELPPGSEIMVPSYTFFATILPMRFFQFVPIFIDVDPRTACFDLEDAKKKLTRNTRAMIPMHSWGLPCEMDQINDWAKEKGLIVIEDAAHAHGASLKGKKMGAWGDMAIFSFQTTKPMPCVEGGMGLYQTREHYERATAFGHYDAPAKFLQDSPYHGYDNTGFGMKYRMHPLAAVLGREQLKVLDQRNAAVRARVRKMNERLLQLPGLSEPRCRSEAERVYYNFDMLFIDEAKAGFSRDSAVKALVAEGVRATAGAYPEQHQFKIYSEGKWWHHPPDVPKVLAGCQQVNATCIRLPLFYEDEPELTGQYLKAFEKVWARRSELARI